MAFARVQGITTTTNVATFVSTVTSGNFVVGLFSWDTGTGVTLTSVTDDKSNTYTVSDNINDTTNNQGSACFFLGNITNGPKVITVNLSGAAASEAMLIDEFSGALAAADPRNGHVGQLQTAPGTGTDAITSTAITTTIAGDMIWGGTCCTDGVFTSSVGTGFTLSTANVTNEELRTEFLTQGSAGSVAATFTQAAAHRRITFVIAFKPPSIQPAPEFVDFHDGYFNTVLVSY